MQLGTEDPYGRGKMLGHIIRILRVKKPKYVLLENVKGFLSSKFDYIRNQMVSDLIEIGYGTSDKDVMSAVLLNSKDYGVPQNRERVWMFAKLGGIPDGFSIRPEEARNDLRVKDMLDIEPDKKLYRSEQQVAHLKEKNGFDSLDVDQPYCVDLYNHKIKRDGFCITLKQPEHNDIRLVEPPRDGKELVRKFSEHELFRLMGFRISRDKSESEIDFAGLSYSQLAKRAGNGWDINVVERIFKKLIDSHVIEL
jgi:DNA (cytosine-5)-methyltransferase 1